VCDGHHTGAVGVHREQAPDDRRLGLVDDAVHVAVAVPCVAIPVDAPSGDRARLGPAPECIVGAGSSPAPLEASDQGIDVRLDFARFIVERHLAALQIPVNLDAGILDSQDGRQRARVAPDARQLRDHQRTEGRGRFERGQE
jgi:hypothetical protein